ncbi:Uncharacterised protein [Streptococcus pneumoniae]|nr:Uncharacterised protein [Streptococcus pneumoniae]CJC61994.1 Uncharacterised protein [Streptococcus pneumoniae]CKF42143.1 Uncharacterised protein [Streptococcus pneumoniae]COU07973.1 Uncharacterised protein [Streptococcus pneumoniae]
MVALGLMVVPVLVELVHYCSLLAFSFAPASVFLSADSQPLLLLLLLVLSVVVSLLVLVAALVAYLQPAVLSVVPVVSLLSLPLVVPAAFPLSASLLLFVLVSLSVLLVAFVLIQLAFLLFFLPASLHLFVLLVSLPLLASVLPSSQALQLPLHIRQVARAKAVKK